LPRVEEVGQPKVVRNVTELNIEPAPPPEPVRMDPTPSSQPPSDHCSLLYAMEIEPTDEPSVALDSIEEEGDLRVPRPFWTSKGFIAGLGIAVCLAVVMMVWLKRRGAPDEQMPSYAQPPAVTQKATPTAPKISFSDVNTKSADESASVAADEIDDETADTVNMTFPPEEVSTTKQAVGTSRRARARARKRARRSRWARRVRRARRARRRSVDVDGLLSAGDRPRGRARRASRSVDPDTILASARSKPRRSKTWRSGYHPAVPAWMK
jgi:hypothetical protein